MKLIIAGNLREFKEYCRQNNLKPNEVVGAFREGDVLGRFFESVDFVGNYSKNPLYKNDLEFIKSRVRL